MAPGIVPTPGTMYGPCAWECTHMLCAHGRKTAMAICHLCGKPIGYDTEFDYAGGRIVHAACKDKWVNK